MRRREALRLFGAAALSGWVSPNLRGLPWADEKEGDKPIKRLPNTFSKKKYYAFKPWNPGKTLAPVTRVTPGDGFYVHTYFDVTPFSPSQRYFAVTRLPFQYRQPVLGDEAEVCVIDLLERSIRTVYVTKCWGYQRGANIHWGATDDRLYANDVIDGEAVCVSIDLETTETLAYAGPLYSIAPDESFVVGFPHELRDVTQIGYGVPPRDPHKLAHLPPGAAKNEGIWRTDLKTNEKRLIVSLADVAERMPTPPPFAGGTYYFWHTKYNRQSTRLLQMVRYMHPEMPDTRNITMFTFNPDGTDVCYVPKTDRVPVWRAAGGHSNWHPDGVHVIRSMKPIGEDVPRYIQARYDGTEFKILSETIRGGGNPSLEPKGKYLITDDRDYEDDVAVIKLRLVDLVAEEDAVLCTIGTIDKAALKENVFRLDGHPAWSSDYRKVSLQAAPEGKRQLFVADLNNLI